MRALLVVWLGIAPTGGFRIDFGSTRWARLQRELDELPAFTCVNQAGEPLGYERDGKQLAIFFADADRAEQELAMANGKFPELGLRIIGVGLGETYRRCADGMALLVPGAAALEAAGDEWKDDSQLPLFTCLAMSRPRDGDGPSETETPLFMDPSMAAATLSNTRETAERSAGGELPAEVEAQLQVVCTSLDKAIELVLSGKEAETCGDCFGFVPPRRSIEFLQAQQRKAGGSGGTVVPADWARGGAASGGGIFPE
eukprot:4626447-Prymnesium_polylepis.1